MWESHKAYIRGQIISYVANKNNERNKRFFKIEQSIIDIDKKCAIYRGVE